MLEIRVSVRERTRSDWPPLRLSPQHWPLAGLSEATPSVGLLKMHELSIAQGLIEVACEALSGCEPPPVRVRSVLIRVGALSGVVPEALQFCYELSVQGTPLEGSRLSVEEQPVVVFCPRCLENRILQDASRFRCPVCDTLTPQLIHGRELELISMEVIDHDEQTSGCPDDLDPGTP